jgi:YggT family protein
MVPAVWQLDLPTLLLALMVEIIYLSATLWLHDYQAAPLALLLWSLLKLLKISVYLLMGALFIEALLSWTNPHTMLAPVLHSITRPFLKPLHRLVPQKGSLDFSFLILFFLCFLIVSLPLSWLEALLLKNFFSPTLPPP